MYKNVNTTARKYMENIQQQNIADEHAFFTLRKTVDK